MFISGMDFEDADDDCDVPDIEIEQNGRYRMKFPVPKYVCHQLNSTLHDIRNTQVTEKQQNNNDLIYFFIISHIK